MNITEPRFEKYMKDISLHSQLRSEDDIILREMEAYASENHFPIIGPLVGRFIRQLAIITKAESIFEMGSGYGYSAAWFAGGMKPGGKIICTEGSGDNKKRAIKYLSRLGYGSMVEFHVGDARDIIKNHDGPFDIILNDINKDQYPETVELVIPRLRSGGVFITDNVLWSGDIFDKTPDAATKGILEFNKLIFDSADIFSSIIPIRDGLGMAVKI